MANPWPFAAIIMGLAAAGAATRAVQGGGWLAWAVCAACGLAAVVAGVFTLLDARGR